MPREEHGLPLPAAIRHARERGAKARGHRRGQGGQRTVPLQEYGDPIATLIELLRGGGTPMCRVYEPDPGLDGLVLSSEAHLGARGQTVRAAHQSAPRGASWFLLLSWA